MAFIIGNVDDSLLPQSVKDALSEDVPCYGVRFDGTNSQGIRTYDATNLNWTRSSDSIMGTDDFANLAPFNVRECITQYNSGTGERDLLAYKGDANWGTLVTNKTGERMIEVPCFWYARPSRYEFVVSPRAKIGFKPSPMHYRNGVLHDKIRITKYNLGGDYTSQPGYYPIVNTNMNTFRTNLQAKGLQLMDYPTWCMLVQLMIIKYANMNVQTTVGSGRNSGNSTISSGGTDNVLGLDGSSTTVGANESVLTLGIENFFSNVWKYIDGLYGYNGTLYIKDVESMVSDPVDYQELMRDYTPIGTTFPTNASNTSIKTIAYDSGFDWMQYPVESGTPNPSGDNWWSAGGFQCVIVGGDAWHGSADGLFTFAVDDAVGYTYGNGGALGVEIVPNVNTTINPANVSTFNNKYFNTTSGLKLKTEYDIPMSVPTAITDGVTTKYTSESDPIDFNEFKSVEGVDIV